MSKIRGFTQAYYKENIVGPVSQVGGIPTGAIIERGSNPSGEYTKYADGTLICRQATSITSGVTLQSGSLFYTGPAVALTYPSTFISLPTISITATKAGGAAIWVAPSNNETITQWPSVYIMAETQRPSSEIRVNYLAYGRWY